MATSNPDISEEEINYSRFSLGVLKVTPQVLRLVFTNRHPDLKTFLALNKGKCQHLRNTHVLTRQQWDLLYPATGAAILNDFDTTLLILLLRNVSNVNPPSTGWHKDPLPSDTSLGADLLRLRGIRNDHVHCKDMRISNSEFGKKWSELTMIVTRIGGIQFQEEMNFYVSRPLEDTDSGRTIKREIEVLRSELKSCIPENIKERGRKLIKKALSHRFVKTKAYKHALKRLKEGNVLTITGTIGSGKKTLASQLALHFSRRNYVIIPINDRSEILQYCRPDENQVFIINDPFGTSSLDANEFAKWSKYQDDIRYQLENSTRSKVIFTCRLSIFKNEKCKSLFDIWYRNAINISEGEHGLTHNDRLSLLRMYKPGIDSKGLSENTLHILNNPSLPLLCKSDIMENLANFGAIPLDIYIMEIRQLSITNPDHYLTLLHVLARKNHLFKERECNYEFTISELIGTFGIRTRPMSSLLQPLEVLLEEMVGSFLKETGGMYSFINDTVYDILAYNAGLQSQSFAIRSCSRDFFRNNISFNRENSNASRLRILLNEDNFTAWFERLMYEIENGCFLDIVFCTEFYGKTTTKLLIEQVNRLSSTELMQMLSGTEHEIQFLDNIPVNKSCILRDFPLNNRPNFLFGIIIAGHHELFSVIWNIIKKLKLYNNFDESDLLKAAVIGGNVSCVQKFVKKVLKRTNPLLSIIESMQEKYKRVLLSSSPMCVACACNHLALVEFLYKLGFDVNEKSEHGNTPLAYAARFGNEEVVRYLLSKNAVIDTQNKDGRSPLMWAVENDAIVDILIDNGANICLSTDEGEHVLMMACGLGRIKAVEKILKSCNQRLSPGNKETFINQRKVNGVTALHKVCECKDKGVRFDIAYRLLKENANPQTCDVFQMSSPLHLASAQNDDRLINLLLFKKNDDVNCIDKDGVTPLFIAAENCYPRLVSTLLECGADPLISRKTDGASPLLVSSERGHLEIVTLLLQTMENGIGINCVNFQDSTPLLLATLNNKTKVCEMLLESGADVNILNKNGYNTILVASRNGNARLIHLYLKKGVDINSQTASDKNTPLHLAAMMGHKTATKYLLVNGADIELKNQQGLTPSVIATYKKQKEISDLLYQFRMYGSNVEEFQTPSVQSPRTQTTLFSSESSVHCHAFSMITCSPPRRRPNGLNPSSRKVVTEIPDLTRAPSRMSIASSSAGSVVYSDVDSIKSSSSFTSLSFERN